MHCTRLLHRHVDCILLQLLLLLLLLLHRVRCSIGFEAILLLAHHLDLSPLTLALHLRLGQPCSRLLQGDSRQTMAAGAPIATRPNGCGHGQSGRLQGGLRGIVRL